MSDTETRPRKRRGIGVAAVVALLTSTLVLAVGGVTFAVWSHEQARSSEAAHAAALTKKKKHDKAVEAADAAADAAAAEARRVADQKASNDASAAAAGLAPSPTDDNVYYKTDSTGTCSTFLPCAWLDIVTTADCSAGVYVSANLVTSSGVVLATGNKITGALTPNQPAVIELVFTGSSDGAAEYNLTDAHCM